MSAFTTKTLDDICDRTRPFPVVDGPFGTQLHADEYKPQGIPLVRVTNLSFEGRFRPEDLVFISGDKAAEIRRSEVFRDDLIVAKTGATIGKCGLFPFAQGIIASSCIKISVDRVKADPRFLLHRVVSPEGQKAILDGASGSTRTTINIGPFKQIAFPFPEAAEQSRIAAVLDTMDEVIAKTTAAIMKLKQIGYGLLHDLLTRGLDEHGQLRDPLAHPEQFEDSSLRRIPKKWRIVQLRDIAIGEGVYGSGAAAKSYDPHLPRYVRITDITDDGTLDNNSLASIGESDAGPYLLREGDLVFARSGATVGKTYLYRAHDGRCAHAGYVIKFAIDPTKASPHFVFFWTKSSMYWRWVNRMLRQGAQPNINAPEYATHLLTVPPIEEQGQITKMLEEFAVARAKETAVLEKLVNLKSGLANDLLTGRIRVPESLFPRESSP